MIMINLVDSPGDKADIIYASKYLEAQFPPTDEGVSYSLTNCEPKDCKHFYKIYSNF